MSILEEVLLKEGYGSKEEKIRDWALDVALSKLEKYKAESDFFEKKYGMNLKEFESFLHKEKGSEDFEKEEDIEDWEFSFKALKWWEKKIKELQIVVSDT